MIFSYQKQVYVQDQGSLGLVLQRPVVDISTMKSLHTGAIRRFKVWGSTTFGTAALNISINGVSLQGVLGGYFSLAGSNDLDVKDDLDIAVTENDIISLTVISTGQAGISNIHWQVDIDDGATLVEETNGVTTASLSDNAIEVGTITIGKGFIVKKVETSDDARIRLYQTAAARTADAARIFGSYDWLGTEHGIILDLLLNSSTGLEWSMSPPAYGVNGDDPVVETIYYSIQNLSGGTTTIDVDFTFVKFEI